MIKPLHSLAPLCFAAICLLGCSNEAADPLKDASVGPEPGVDVEVAAAPFATSSPPPTAMPMAQRMDCIRENGALVAAHRGGPRRGYPENALETLQKSRENGSHVFEIDVAQSKDGVLFLMHDTDLERTTVATGVAREMTWAQLKDVRLTAYGDPTDFTIPSLRDVLDWAVANNVIVELDKKRSTDFADIIAEVRTAEAENNVILITYTYDQAEDVARLAPEMVMTASVQDPSDVDELIGRGVNIDNLIAWTGTDTLNPGLWSDLKARGVEVAFGTLGRRGDRFDDQFWEDRNGSEYNELVAAGVTLVATDYSDRVSRQLVADDRAIAVCGF